MMQRLEQAFRSKKRFSGDLRTDFATRLLYSTDASIYQIEPLGVVFPRDADELAAAVEIAAEYRIPVIARGAGSGLAGQAIGTGLIVDCSRYLNHIFEIDPERRTASVEPGVILNALNRAAARYRLQFGPDPASAERATLGGSLANNASGAHSILFGMAADHLLSVEVILADGCVTTFQAVSMQEAQIRAGHENSINQSASHSQSNTLPSIEASLYQIALHIRREHAALIHRKWPLVWRRASGYNLNYLLPWSPSTPPLWEAVDWGDISTAPRPYPPVTADTLNLAPLIAGSEGTLGVIRKAVLQLVPLPDRTVLGVLAFNSLAEACDAVPEIIETKPAAVELIPKELILLARSVPAYAQQLKFLDRLSLDDGSPPAALLVVEYAGEKLDLLLQATQGLVGISRAVKGPLVAQGADQSQVWAVRKVGLGILMSRPGDLKPWPFIEDLAVPVERLGEFIREMERLLAAYNTRGEIYAHASAGCLHIRPLLNLKTIQGVTELRSIASEAVSLVLRLGGAVSGEHGDGCARSEWMEQMFGPELVNVFRQVKQAADPYEVLNPGKIVTLDRAKPVSKMDTNLRFGPNYQVKTWPVSFDFSSQAGLAGAIEQCNGSGVCRKAEGVMCPSFQATQDEKHSTRGRANLLRAMIAGRFPTEGEAEKTVYEALDLCLACKGCKAECPSAVDMAKLKYEFTNHYYHQHPRKWRDYLFAYIDRFAWLGHHFPPLANFVLHNRTLGKLAENILGLSAERQLPILSHSSLHRLFAQQTKVISGLHRSERVLFLSDAFTEYFHPQDGLHALQVLEAAGCNPHLLPVIGAGRTLISKGFLEPARGQARRVVEAIRELDPEGQSAVVGLEPSEIYTLRDEYLDLFPGDDWVRRLAGRALMIDEFLVRPGPEGKAHELRIVSNRSGKMEANRITRHPSALEATTKVLLHGHCYQKAQQPLADGYATGVAATIEMLKKVGYQVEVIQSGCCGMAGAFGYEAEHYPLSMQVGELGLLPAIRKADPDVIIAAAGVSCQAQIEDGTHRHPVHPISLVPINLFEQ